MALFDEMDAVLGGQHATELPITIDTSMEHQDVAPNERAANAKDKDAMRDQSTDKSK